VRSSSSQDSSEGSMFVSGEVVTAPESVTVDDREESVVAVLVLDVDLQLNECM